MFNSVKVMRPRNLKIVGTEFRLKRESEGEEMVPHSLSHFFFIFILKIKEH